MNGLIAGCEKHLASCPGQLILIGKIISVMSNFLISARPAIAGNGVGQKLPTELGLLEISGRGCGIRALERG